MDQHLQFRIDSLKHPALLGQSKPSRFPVSSSPSVRSCCSQQDLKRPATPTVSASSQPTPSAPAQANPTPTEVGSDQVRAQVKQLQFWLRVFSRFCQGGPDRE